LNVSKNLSAGEGGLFVTDDEQACLVARRLSVFGEDLVPLAQRSFRSHGVGFNYRNQELSCALARSQLPRLDGYNRVAQRNAMILTDGLAELPGIVVPRVASDRACSYWKYMVHVNPAEMGFDGQPVALRDRVLAALRAQGVEAMVWQPQPLPAMPAFRRPLRPWQLRYDAEPLQAWDPAEYPVASRLCDTSFALGTERYPLYVQASELMRHYVAACRLAVTES
ncbi:MAG: DegT/DnrJ/EryC1/StrS family aminotransferase, partial [Pseudonocardiaceae bacterium]